MGNGSETTTSDIAEWQKPYFNSGGAAADKILGGQFKAYGGNRVAGLNPLETQATGALQSYDFGAPQYQQAQDIYSGIANMTPQDYAAMNQQNMNPYQDQVIGSMEAVAARRRAQERVGEANTVTNSRAFGNDRRGTFEGERQATYELGQNELVSNLMKEGYSQSQAATMAQLQTRSGAAGNIASTAGAAGSQFLSGIGAQMGAGGLARGIDQAGLDAQYEEFGREQQDPYTRMNAYQGFLGSLPQTQVSTTTKKPGMLDYITAASGAASAYYGSGGANSDARLKENIKPAGKIGGFNAYTWDWNAEGKRIGADRFPTSGVIAQEVAVSRPDLVATDAHGYLTVNYAGL
jgi:hypothetical protein